MEDAVVCNGEDGKDLGIPGCYYMFHDKNYCMRALAELLTTKNDEMKQRDFKMWLQKKLASPTNRYLHT